MSDLVEFLLARIAEDEAQAQAFEQNYRLLKDPLGRPLTETEPLPPQMTHARVLAECEAKRRIVAWATDGEGEFHWSTVLYPLAAVHADHPDYDETWRP